MICFQDFWGSSNLWGCPAMPQHQSSATPSNLFNFHFHGNYSNLFSLIACLQSYLLSFALQVFHCQMVHDQMKWPSPNFSWKPPFTLCGLTQSMLLSSCFSFPKPDHIKEHVHACAHLSFLSHGQELDENICEAIEILFFCSCFQILIYQLWKIQEKIFKRERQINSSGEYNWLYKQLRLFFSLWFLQAYFYPCFITKPFPLLDYL